MELSIHRETLDAELAWLASHRGTQYKTGGSTLSRAHCALDPVTNRRIYRSGSFIGLLAPVARGLWSLYQRTVGSFAQLVTDPAVANAALVWTARAAGVGGNAITVALVNPGVGGTLAVAVAAAAITVTLATDGAGVITTIANDIIAAIRANADANALVYIESERAHDGSGLVTAIGATNLANGVAAIGAQATLTTGLINVVADTSVIYTANTLGLAGNNIQIAYVVPAGAGVPLSIEEAGAGTAGNPYVITVNLETAGAGVAVSTIAQIIAAINAHFLTAPLVTAVAEGLDTGVPLVAYGPTTLANGTDLTVSLVSGQFGLLMHDVDVTDSNALGGILLAGRVLDARLPAASDAFVRAALPLVAFTTENAP